MMMLLVEFREIREGRIHRMPALFPGTQTIQARAADPEEVLREL
jgi:hypothetical protein